MTYTSYIRDTASLYDTIRHGIFTCAQRWREGQLNLAHGTKNEKEKLKTKKRVAPKKRSGIQSVKAVRGQEVKLYHITVKRVKRTSE